MRRMNLGGARLDHPIAFALAEQDHSLAEALRGGGYRTQGYHGGGFVAGTHGFGRGFDAYEPANSDAFSRAARYVRENAGPFFLFVHTYVIHRPYLHENIFAGESARPTSLEKLNPRAMKLDGQTITPIDPEAPLYGWRPEAEEIEYFKAMYDGGIRQADLLLATLVEALKEADLYDDALIIVVSDHGEEFWEHIPEGSPEHNHSLFDELLHIPLIVKLPGGEGAGTEVRSLVRILDVMPTVLEIAGIPYQAESLEGRSLAPLIKGGTDDREIFVGHTFMGPMRFGVRTGRYKYIVAPSQKGFAPGFKVPKEALYDLETDPGELTNLAEADSETLVEMRRKLDTHRRAHLPRRLLLSDSPAGRHNREALGMLGLERYRGELGQHPASAPTAAPEVDEAEMKSLKALGYLE
jgi:arylsulfatase A-like enzyme